uniref:Uncharacterized protein n=1 Tax=Anguilla anguilla TaxID=7936 RepID=A0A0E9V300_ANGAN
MPQRCFAHNQILSPPHQTRDLSDSKLGKKNYLKLQIFFRKP